MIIVTQRRRKKTKMKRIFLKWVLVNRTSRWMSGVLNSRRFTIGWNSISNSFPFHCTAILIQRISWRYSRKINFQWQILTQFWWINYSTSSFRAWSFCVLFSFPFIWSLFLLNIWSFNEKFTVCSLKTANRNTEVFVEEDLTELKVYFLWFEWISLKQGNVWI